MSNFESDVEIDDVTAGGDDLAPTMEVLSPRTVFLGPRQEVRRVLPNKNRRTIGAWCFVDHYGPENVSEGSGMRVPPHPHTGLQTVSWLLEGAIHHRDTLGSDAQVVPGELNLMTAGPGIAHSEESQIGDAPVMHGLQLWVALPDHARHEAARAFAQHRALPVIERPGLRATVVMGELEGTASDAHVYSPLVGAELHVEGTAQIGLEPEYEYGLLAIDDGISVEGQLLDRSEIAYVGVGRSSVTVATAGASGRAFLLGGEPFTEKLVMWWNFIGRTHEEIVEFRRTWNDDPGGVAATTVGDQGRLSGQPDGQFGVVQGFDGDRLLAPPMPTVRLQSRGRQR